MWGPRVAAAIDPRRRKERRMWPASRVYIRTLGLLSGNPVNWKSWLRQAARASLARLLPRSLYLTHGPKSSGTVCLTFDDGPHPERTPRLLDLLAQEKARATFFVIGREAERHPAIVRRMEAEGHMVGHHSYSHLDPTQETVAAMLDDTRRSMQVLAEILGHPVRLYRPPRGKLRAMDFPALWSLKQTIVLWNVDPKDFSRDSPGQITDCFAARPLEGGDLVLLHDPTAHTLAALPTILAAARASGLQPCSLEAWARWQPGGNG